MANFEADDGTTRDDLVQRVALMEAMIAEGRQSTARFGWVIVMWGLVYFVAVVWTIYLPFAAWAWPVCVTAAIVVGIMVGVRQRRRGASYANLKGRSIAAVWQAMCAAIILYVIAGNVSHHCNSAAFFSAILFFVALAHGTSALILRWGAQGTAAAVWFAAGTAMFFTTPAQSIVVFLAAAFFGQMLFGLYVMMLERRRAAALELHHA